MKQYQQSITELVDDFERELQLKDEIIVGLHAEIAKLRRNATDAYAKTKMVDFLISDDGEEDDVEEIDESDDNYPIFDDREETLVSPYPTPDGCFDAVPNPLNDDHVIADDVKLIETIADNDYDDDVDEEDGATPTTDAMGDCFTFEQRTPTLLSIKIQPNKNEMIHQCELCRKIVSTRRTLMVCWTFTTTHRPIDQYSYSNFVFFFFIQFHTVRNRNTFESSTPLRNRIHVNIVHEVFHKRTDSNGIYASIQVVDRLTNAIEDGGSHSRHFLFYSRFRRKAICVRIL